LNSKISVSNRNNEAKPWWFMAVILATQEAEIRRIIGQNQPGQTVHETLSQKNRSQKGKMELFKV
jgi:hypothetical protein